MKSTQPYIVLPLLLIAAFFFLSFEHEHKGTEEGIVKYKISISINKNNEKTQLYNDSSYFYRYGDYLLRAAFEERNTTVIKNGITTSSDSTVFKHWELLSLQDSMAYIFINQNNVFIPTDSFSLKRKQNTGLNIFFKNLYSSDSLVVKILEVHSLNDKRNIIKFQTTDSDTRDIVEHKWILDQKWSLPAFRLAIKTENKIFEGFLAEAISIEPLSGIQNEIKLSYIEGLPKVERDFIIELVDKSLYYRK